MCMNLIMSIKYQHLHTEQFDMKNDINIRNITHNVNHNTIMNKCAH